MMPKKIHYTKQAVTLDIIAALMSDIINAERAASKHEEIEAIDLDLVKERNRIRWLAQECWSATRR